MLSFGDVNHLFSLVHGIKDFTLQFATVSVFADKKQPKGLYIPLNGEPDINRAIASGAITALWKKDTPVPRYIPNDFPLFVAEGFDAAFLKIVQYYLKQIESKDFDMKTSFIFYGPECRDMKPHTYDLAGREGKALLLQACNRWKGRGKA